jgi:general secretion pathway protein M
MRQFMDNTWAAFDRLSAREQVLVFVMVVAILGMIVGFGGYLVRSDLQKREVRIEAKLDKLREVAALRSDYRRRLAEQKALAQEVRGNANTRVLSYLESMSERANIELANVRGRRGEATGSDLVTEDAAEVEIRNVSIDRLDAFLKAIEDGNRLVKVRRLKIRTRFDNPEMLDAQINVGTFKPAS